MDSKFHIIEFAKTKKGILKHLEEAKKRSMMGVVSREFKIELAESGLWVLYIKQTMTPEFQKEADNLFND